MALKARQPEEVKPKRAKFLISADSGFGKTFFALQFPNLYFIDTEGGANRPQYVRALKANGGVYMGIEEGSQDFKTVIEEIKALATTKHNFKTVVVDSTSYLYMLSAAEAEERVGNDYAKDKKEANRPSRQLIRFLEKLDMNVILIAHSKDKWVNKGGKLVSEGKTFDFFDKTEFILDVWLEIIRKPTDAGKWKDGQMIVRKSRVETMPADTIIPLQYEKFCELYGKEIIEKEVVPLTMATSEQLIRVKQLVDTLKVPETQIEKWFKLSNVDEWQEMTSAQVQQCIDLMQKKISELGASK